MALSVKQYQISIGNLEQPYLTTTDYDLYMNGIAEFHSLPSGE